MQAQTIEYIGYLASILVVISLTLKDVKWLRIINTFGGIAFVVYALLLGTYPVVLTNVSIVVINLYHLNRLRKVAY